MNNETLIDITLEALNDAKALDINVFDVRNLTSISDYMIIASGRLTRKVSAIADRVVEAAKKHDVKPLGIEGKSQGEWVLVDLGDVIVHLMHPESREYYQLEKLWKPDAEQARTV